MPVITITHVILLVLSAIIGLIVGWLIRGGRSAQEKAAINAGWKERIAAQETEHHRLVIQNRSLMDQISDFQASNRDAKMQARELSDATEKANERHEILQREIKDIRNNLEIAVAQRNQLQIDIAARSESDIASKEKDEKIFQLSRELENWTKRLPPLIERYNSKNEEAEELEAALFEARARIEHLESAQACETRVEPMRDADALTDGHDASNDATESQVNHNSRAFETAINVEHATLRDDLKQIKGVGPAIEKTLNEMGIFRFRQIADMSEYDIDRVAQRLRGFHSRIYRENWIGQARDLIDVHSGG